MVKEKEELYELRNNSLKFYNLKDFREGILDFFSEDFKFPLISGYIWDRVDKYCDWKISNINPREISDELTVRNFLGGLEELSKSGACLSKTFKGELYFYGVERRSSEYYGCPLLLASFNDGCSDYVLDLKFTQKSEYNNNNNLLSNLAYSASSYRDISLSEKIMNKYLGPNQNE